MKIRTRVFLSFKIIFKNFYLNILSNTEIIRKKPDQTVVFNQEVSIRYLRPPTPPPPGMS
jgi:hypothetical protein